VVALAFCMLLAQSLPLVFFPDGAAKELVAAFEKAASLLDQAVAILELKDSVP